MNFKAKIISGRISFNSQNQYFKNSNLVILWYVTMAIAIVAKIIIFYNNHPNCLRKFAKIIKMK